MRQLLPVVTTLVLMVLFPSSINAQIVINEFCPNCNPEWVELYNISDSPVDLSGWEIQDGNTKSIDDLTISGEIPPLGMVVYEHQKGWLNDSNDTINLYDNTDNISTVDSYSYTSTKADKTYSRVPDGSGDFIITDPTKGGFNQAIITAEPTVTISSTPTLSPTQIITPSPTKAISTSPTPTSYRTGPVIVATPTRIFSAPPVTETSSQITPDTASSSASFLSASESAKRANYPALILGESITPQLSPDTNQPSDSTLKTPMMVTGTGLLTLASFFTYIIYNSRNPKN